MNHPSVTFLDGLTGYPGAYFASASRILASAVP